MFSQLSYNVTKIKRIFRVTLSGFRDTVFWENIALFEKFKKVIFNILLSEFFVRDQHKGTENHGEEEEIWRGVGFCKRSRSKEQEKGV